jgi:hypothetical protein
MEELNNEDMMSIICMLDQMCIISVNKPRMKWVGHMAWIINAYRMLDKKPEKKGPFQRPRWDRDSIKIVLGCGLDSCGLG